MAVSTSAFCYPYKTGPRAHQREWFERTRDLVAHADYSEMGTGKTKVTIDTAAWLYLTGRIRGVLVLAPNSVAPNWTLVELPKHLPDEVKVRSFLYLAPRAGTKRHAAELGAFLDPRKDGLAVLAMPYTAFMTDGGKEAAWQLLRSRPVLFVLDECQAIKTPSTRTSKRVVKAGVYAAYRRALTGTPIADKPFDAFAPVRFLEPRFWQRLGIGTFAGFKSYFGVFKPIPIGPDRFHQLLVGYRNLAHLREALKAIGHRVLKKDVLDLPPKSYTTRFFQLPPVARRRYEEIEDGVLEALEGLGEVDDTVVGGNVMQLRRAACGIYPGGDDDQETIGRTARLELCLEVVDDALESSPDRGVIVWTSFPSDVRAIAAALEKRDVPCSRMYGEVRQEDRAREVERFQAGETRVFVGNPQVGGSGLTLTRATTVVYYSCSFALSERLQSEDRAHRDGQDRPVLYIDIVAQGTIDEKIIDALVKKDAIARVCTAEGLREWIVQRKKRRRAATLVEATGAEPDDF